MNEPIAFGPIFSRRFGLSLGINFFRNKTCNYRCIYCQIPEKTQNSKESIFYSVQEITEAFRQKLRSLKFQKITPQVVTLISAGEPTLFPFLSEVISKLKSEGIPLALITNGTWLKELALSPELRHLGFISVKLDTVHESLWKKINRPLESHDFFKIQDEILKFSNHYQGILYTETMLVRDINDTEEILKPILERIGEINPHRAYFSIPLRPPVCSWVKAPEDICLQKIQKQVRKSFKNSFFLFNDISKGVVVSGDLLDDLRATSLIHPLKEEAVTYLLKEKGISQDQLVSWVEKGFFEILDQNGERYYRAKKEEKNET